MVEWTLVLDADQVLRGQGADPAIIRRRSPRLVTEAEEALSKGRELIRPRVYQKRLKVESFTHQKIRLQGGATLSGPLLADHLAAASEVVAVICSIGSELEAYASEFSTEDIVRALALDGVGSAGVEALANAVCAEVERQAVLEGLLTTIPLSPGMEGWPVEYGQPQIFGLWDGEDLDVQLTPSLMMSPRKSLSMILGLGEAVRHGGSTCDYCSLRASCRYQDHYQKDISR